MPFPDLAQFSNLLAIDALYTLYQQNPDKVDPSWRSFFQGFELGETRSMAAGGNQSIAGLIDAYRRYGHLNAKVNPLFETEESPLLAIDRFGFTAQDLQKTFPTNGFCGKEEAMLQELIFSLRQMYSSRIGFEYMGTGNLEMEKWFQSKIEPELKIELAPDEKEMALKQLIETEQLESFIHTRYPGQKRFSIEGGESLLPMMLEILQTFAEHGMEDVVIGMAHRGRLNVLANVFGKPLSTIFQEFEDALFPYDFEGSGDVKYHKGFSIDWKTRNEQKIHIHLAANSSCLEAVDPVALGLVKAKQKKKRAASILVHGDASLAGQGVVYESLQFMRIDGYATNGTIHIAVNNQVGFTTTPNEGRSTRYCTDIAKTFSVPVLHVSAEDPDACVYAARLAAEFRKTFGVDIFLDLVCYRKYGHNEGDEPAFTQPKEYKIIRSKGLVSDLYLGMHSELKEAGEKHKETYKAKLNAAFDTAKKGAGFTAEELYGSHWSQFKQPPAETLFQGLETAATGKKLEEAMEQWTHLPASFNLHPKLQKLLKERSEMASGALSIDWGGAECMAFATILGEKIPIRLSGQDCRRGTFSHRHAVWYDQESGAPYFPYKRLGDFDVYNSPLSEFAALGFEYGYSWASLSSMTIWEAQYGDFSIGAQTVIDHYIMAAEQKWARYSNLILLLPHGYEGAGPEHSSARMERFLQLAAINNTQIVNCTTPAQYFHLLRRQALFPIKKPLIVFTPKSLLRSPSCTSKLADLTSGTFQEVIGDKKAKKALICSGKVYFDLVEERKKRNKEEVAIHRLEQLYPVHEEKLKAVLQGVEEIVWVQEEPENMGAWEFVGPYLRKYGALRYAGRKRSSTTATGSHNQHKKELEELMNEAFS